MFNWKKRGRIFIPQEIKDRDWLKSFAQAPSTLEFDNFIRVYFSCRPYPDENGQYVSYSAFVDLDKKDLFKILRIAQKPIFELGNRGCFDEYGTYPTSVIRKDEEIWAFYAGWTRCESVPFNVAIGAGISKDNGETFEKIGKGGPIISYSTNEPFVISGPKIRKFNNVFYLFYIAGRNWIPNNGKPEPVYKIRMATSDDGINWTKADKDLIESRIDINEAQASPDVFYCNNKYHMFFCYRYGLDFRSKQNGYRIGYASSFDLINWERDDTKAGIDVSEEGWDSEMISYPHVFELDGKIFMFYLGNGVGREGFGLAELDGDL
jgi:sucrose-6-phosphate hydrolase SacC (GH32 family)